MSRRDTIIIAVLLNAGLLIVLFATSLKSDKTEETAPNVTVLASNQPEKDIQPAVAVVPVPASSATDSVDQVIQQYVTPQVTGTEPNFLADLQAIGTAPVMESIPTASEQQPAESSFKEIKVKKGDVLERIARQNHVSVDEIMKANKLSSTRLRIGQTLKIPNNKGQTKKLPPANTSDGAKYYTVKNGDNPWTIAVKHHMKVEQLLKLNNIDEDKARRLKPGDRVRIQ
jgi:LysM repeat protein